MGLQRTSWIVTAGWPLAPEPITAGGLQSARRWGRRPAENLVAGPCLTYRRADKAAITRREVTRARLDEPTPRGSTTTRAPPGWPSRLPSTARPEASTSPETVSCTGLLKVKRPRGLKVIVTGPGS